MFTETQQFKLSVTISSIPGVGIHHREKIVIGPRGTKGKFVQK